MRLIFMSISNKNLHNVGYNPTGHVKKLDTLFFLNISKNDYPRAPKPFAMCFYLPM